MRAKYTATIPSQTVQQSFYERVSFVGNSSECWLWQGATTPDGYGEVGGSNTAHRVSYVLSHCRPLQRGEHVLHLCDNPPCVNPAHLFLGDQRSNIADMVSKGRHAKGEMKATSKVTDSDVRYIRGRVDAGEPARRVWRDTYQGVVTYETVRRIASRQGWSHLP